jgi:hypothetical protein
MARKTKEKETQDLIRKLLYKDFEDMNNLVKGLEIIVEGHLKTKKRKGK